MIGSLSTTDYRLDSIHTRWLLQLTGKRKKKGYRQEFKDTELIIGVVEAEANA